MATLRRKGMIWDGGRAGTDFPRHLRGRTVLWHRVRPQKHLFLDCRLQSSNTNSKLCYSSVFSVCFSGVHHYPCVPFLCSTWKLIYSMNYQFYRNDFKFVILSITSLGKLDSESIIFGHFHVAVLVELQNDLNS